MVPRYRAGLPHQIVALCLVLRHRALVLAPLAAHPNWQSALLDVAAQGLRAGSGLRMRAVRAGKRLVQGRQAS